MKPEEYDIIDLVPQRHPMIMIDRLTDAGDKSARGRLFIKASNVFCYDGLFQEAGLIEFMGQTAAACIGYLHLSEGRGIGSGFLAQVRDFRIKSLPAANTEIYSEITLSDDLLTYTIINGRIFQNDLVIAEGELTAFTMPDEDLAGGKR